MKKVFSVLLVLVFLLGGVCFAGEKITWKDQIVELPDGWPKFTETPWFDFNEWESRENSSHKMLGFMSDKPWPFGELYAIMYDLSQGSKIEGFGKCSKGQDSQWVFYKYDGKSITETNIDGISKHMEEY